MGKRARLDRAGFVAIYKRKPNIKGIERQRQLCRWTSTYGRYRMKEWIAVLRAADMAARWHVDQRRKGVAQEPYINHLLEVARLVAEATGGSEPNLVIAALLHDAVEDQGVTSETIANEFGRHVTDIVMEVTDDKTLPKDERKRRQVENAGKKGREASAPGALRVRSLIPPGIPRTFGSAASSRSDLTSCPD